jgi:hypothetical protein
MTPSIETDNVCLKHTFIILQLNVDIPDSAPVDPFSSRPQQSDSDVRENNTRLLAYCHAADMHEYRYGEIPRAVANYGDGMRDEMRLRLTPRNRNDDRTSGIERTGHRTCMRTIPTQRNKQKNLEHRLYRKQTKLMCSVGRLGRVYSC